MVGLVRRAHGVRGAMAIESLVDAPDAIFASGAVLVAGDRNGTPIANGTLHIEDGRPMNREWLVKFAEIDTRDAADRWRGRYLLADRSLVPPLSHNEVYIASLMGMQVEVEGQGRVGRVRDVYTAPQGLLIEVETATGTPLVPWRPELIASVNEDTRTIVLKPLEGLLG